MSVASTQQAVVAAEPTRESLDVLDQLMKPEVQESLTVLVENLPKLAEMVTILTKTYDLVQNVATDQVFIDDIKGGVEEFVKPIQDKAKNLASAAIEANDRAQEESTTIGLFGLLKMLKDPQVQKMFRFSQAFLEVLAERQQQRQ
ncbi:DUF1641 domain-containing protein [Paenibacillus sp. MZ04-78.2]|uniref:DUF1641 domain-containing protein n=1 Tax=Paenibacillus sp. MZ04-78.2 TaxID=2962034 RepID=UPI0020B8DE82|nr:DUF1641 domain-containing protein [Paenibacillus sp. MZ04-78.2]MCP3774883.1 DUF1641 domain-containing protein [Paenibacillus sp. MZ04-78.2]